MIIGKDYIKNADIKTEVEMDLISFIPSLYITRICSILMIKKNDIIYEIKNKYYIDDIESRDLLKKMAVSDFKVIYKKDFIFEPHNKFRILTESTNKFLKSLTNKFILFDADHEECAGCYCKDNQE